MTPGDSALSTGAGLVDLSARGRIRVTGEDRARLLHAMSTNHVQQMQTGDGVYAFFLNAQGRIQADASILCFEDHFLLDTEPETRRSLYEHLDRFIIADDVTLEDISDDTVCLSLEGPNAAEVAGAASVAAPNRQFSHVTEGGLTVAAIHGVRIYAPVDRREEIVTSLEAAGAIAATGEDADRARIHGFRPRYGADITEASLPQETQQMHALHFQKGCYLGQEIIERIRSRGHVNKQLMGFRLEGHAVPHGGAKFFTGGKEAGEVTSACTTGNEVYGLGYVRVPYNKPGGMVEIEGRPAELFTPTA